MVNTLVLEQKRERDVLLSFLLSLGIISVFCYLFEPRWETNDDVGMSMVAHGYGLATYGSPYLIFSNPIWGCIVRSIPDINGVVGYSSATLLCLGLSAWLMLYSLLKLGVSKTISVLGLLLIFARPTLFPQFTINSGLLTVASILGLRAYTSEQSKSLPLLMSALVLAFFGFLARSQEFILVIVVALPLLPWAAIGKQRSLQIGLLFLGIGILFASIVEAHSYTGKNWEYFNQLNVARAPFTDFGASEHLKKRPDIMTRYRFSENDLALVSSWFFADPKIANPPVLLEMLKELGPTLFRSGNNTAQGWSAVKAIVHPLVLPLSLTAALLFLINPKWSTMSAGLLFLAAAFTTGILGRPGVLRVYIPLLSLLVAFSLLQFSHISHNPQRYWQRLSQPTIAFLLLLAFTWNLMMLAPEQAASQEKIQQVQTDLSHFPSEPVVSWGSEFPFEFAYPVLAKPSAFRHIQLYPLGVFTHAPFQFRINSNNRGTG